MMGTVSFPGLGLEFQLNRVAFHVGSWPVYWYGIIIAAGFLLSAAAALRVDSCTIGGMDRDKYDEILGLDGTPYRSVVSVALGYRAKDDDYAREAKVRFPAGEVIDIRA